MNYGLQVCDRSDPKLAEEAGVSDGFVEKVSTGMESKGAIPKVVEREGRDGKTRTSSQAKTPT